jgi:transposase
MTPEQREKRRKRILSTYARTGGIRKTSRELGISIHVVRRVLRGQDRAPKPPKERPPRPSKLDPFKPLIQRLVLDDDLTAVLILEELRALGYEGGYSILKEHVRSIRPRTKRVTTLLEHPPGAEGQVDWSQYLVWLAGERVEVHGFSFVLPFSRWMFVRFRRDERLITLIELHDETFATLGAVPVVMTYDNMTTVGRHVGPGKIWLNPRFEPYMKACGFEVALITPGRPNEHASVERPMHYIENNCLRRRRFRFADLDDLNRHAQWWCAEVANVRIHGTTRERPVDRLQRERAFLLPPPWSRPEPYREVARTVQSDFCVAVDTNRYSVSPRYVGRPATVRVYAERLEILVDGKVVAGHTLGRGRHQRNVSPEHEEEFKRATPSRRLLEQAFVRLGTAAEAYYEGLRAQRGRGAGYHLQRILKLADRYGADAVCGAMAHSARYGNFGADAVARVLTGRELRGNAPREEATAPPPPERVRRWLEGVHVENPDLADYDRLIDQVDAGDTPSEKEEEEEEDDEE